MMPWRYFERPHCIGAWVCTPLEKPQLPPPPGPGLVEEQPQDDGRVAMTDPLIGLLGMQVKLVLSYHVMKHQAIYNCPAPPCSALPCPLPALPCREP